MIWREIVLSNSVRTAIGTFDGSLTTVPATELGATVVRAVLEPGGRRHRGFDKEECQ